MNQGIKLPGPVSTLPRQLSQARPPAAGRVALRRAIATAGVTQARAAEAAGIPERTLRKWLAGDHPTRSLDAYLAIMELGQTGRQAA